VAALYTWNDRVGAGTVGVAPGIIFAEDEAVAPDAVWISKERLHTALDDDRKLHAAPELVVEVLSPGAKNVRRDRQVKLEAYSRRGVDEYWILDWLRRQVEVYRRERTALRLVATLRPPDVLESPLLAGLSVPVARLFTALP
jgi:Uma2 family endonuclease